MGNDLRLFRVLSLKTITGSLPFFYPILRLDRIQFNFTIYHSKLLELEKEQSKLNRLVQSIVTSDPQAPNNFEVLMPCVLSGQLVIDNGRKFTLTSYRYQCSTAQLFLPKKDLK